MRSKLLTGAFAGFLLVGAGCTDGQTPNFGDPGVTEVTLSCSPASPVTGSQATLTVNAQNDLTKIDTVTIDFENDGIWDLEQAFDALSVSASFTHVYDTPGSVVVRTEVEDFGGGIVSKTLLLIVEDPPVVTAR